MIGYTSECCKDGLRNKDIQYWDSEEFEDGRGRWMLVNSNHNAFEMHYCPFCGKKL